MFDMFRTKIEIPQNLHERKEELKTIWREAEKHVCRQELVWLEKMRKKANYAAMASTPNGIKVTFDKLVADARKEYLKKVNAHSKTNAERLVGKENEAASKKLSSALCNVRQEIEEERKSQGLVVSLDLNSVMSLWALGFAGKEVFRKPGLFDILDFLDLRTKLLQAKLRPEL